MNAAEYQTIIIRNQCPDEPRVFSELPEKILQSQLREYAEMGDTEWLVLQLKPEQFRHFKIKPAEIGEVEPSPLAPVKP